MSRRPVIAIDGPAASGKSSTARAVARALGYTHFDSGALYRAVTHIALGEKSPPERWTEEHAVASAAACGVSITTEGGCMHVRIAGHDPGDALRTDAVNRHVSRIAAMPKVRDFVNGLLRAAAAEGGVVMDGRDIGTVVFPDAEVKVFMVADAAERARRRLLEKGAATDHGAIAQEASALQDRDARDSGRDVAPLVPAEGAVHLDTTNLSLEDQVRTIVELARKTAPGYT